MNDWSFVSLYFCDFKTRLYHENDFSQNFYILLYTILFTSIYFYIISRLYHGLKTQYQNAKLGVKTFRRVLYYLPIT